MKLTVLFLKTTARMTKNSRRLRTSDLEPSSDEVVCVDENIRLSDSIGAILSPTVRAVETKWIPPTSKGRETDKRLLINTGYRKKIVVQCAEHPFRQSVCSSFVPKRRRMKFHGADTLFFQGRDGKEPFSLREGAGGVYSYDTVKRVDVCMTVRVCRIGWSRLPS